MEMSKVLQSCLKGYKSVKVPWAVRHETVMFVTGGGSFHDFDLKTYKDQRSASCKSQLNLYEPVSSASQFHNVEAFPAL